MVSLKFCQEMVQRSLHKRFQITVIGEERWPAYDRVRLSSYVDHQDPQRLVLRPAEWYADHGIELRTNTRVTTIHRELSCVRLSNEEALNYDALVLATGSRPFVPEIAGSDLPNVFVYRTLRDLKRLIGATREVKEAAIIGGGLLGLEAAQAVQKLGLRATVVERGEVSDAAATERGGR